ncbi:QRFP-like peptide receptor isoform X2 [Nematostella vectensis]|uniref:QRFP-like peptide receptor isoform X2 n=1 Tax=Nematostella vectensis TaxID=45351 RepID=UPI00138FE8D1|nr:QRFP-like peptide receptor isoform X2 [Nematostella vectensis]XP_048585146.1 QRFP-like peptide receptor isoform X2 [Nematostella vectensis]XP_048585147.1 QRFP-like peptide receptor isoform X2 [Nematostella vectensis]XP_048585148.1 QRFP-like peptide receptor isoform X2 [Nematostella vectensis]XP_048585149.1 QRFP-like peptide receptor isoform X2 [Nematostella vectensis]XP_048585150.1 QRFP-like peptide receptor isoform X2 [Nematostella vectensis]XP_048585151.1 QRFP-like peptide receptor isofo
MINSTVSAGNSTSSPGLTSPMRGGLIFIYVTTLVMALLGNALSLLVVYRRRCCKNTMNVMIANMCVADMLVVVVVIPFMLSYIHKEEKWQPGVWGDVTCKLSHYTSVVSIAASILTILFISCERYIAICHPMRGHFLRMPRVITTLIWLLALILMSPYLIIYKNVYVNGTWYCTEDFGDSRSMPMYLRIHYLVLFILLYAYPIMMIGALNSAIICRLTRHRMPGEEQVAGQQSHSRAQAAKSRRKAVRMLFILVVVFAVCWLPTHLMHLFITERRDILVSLPRYLPFLLFWFGYFNSALNPCIYVLFSANFRRDLKLLIMPSERTKTAVTVKMTMSDRSGSGGGSGVGRFVRRWSGRSSTRGHSSSESPAAKDAVMACVQLNGVNRSDERRDGQDDEEVLFD